MTLSKREKVLALVVGILGAVLLTYAVGSLMVSPIRERYATRTSLRKEVEKKEQDVEAARLAKKKMEDWRGRSLSADAQGLYDVWLLEIFPGFSVTAPAKIVATKVPSGLPGTKAPTYTKLDYTLKGQVSLEQLIRSLYKFYLAGYLHQIHSLTIAPAEKSTDLAVTLIVQVLSLPDSPATQELPRAQPPARKPEKELTIYIKDIADRKPFEPFTPIKPEVVQKPPPPPPKFDVLKYVFVSAIVTVEGRPPEAWIRDRTTDKDYRLHPGERVEVGAFKGTVGEITGREVEFLINGDPIRIGLGDPLKKPNDSATKPLPGFADAKVATPSGLTDKGKSADRRGKSSAEADSSGDPRGKAGAFRKTRPKGGKGKQADDQKTGQ